MNKIQTVKFVARFVVGVGVTGISRNIIANNVQPVNVIDQITTTAGALVIGSMASEAAKAHTDRQIDAIVDVFTKSKTANETTTA